MCGSPNVQNYSVRQSLAGKSKCRDATCTTNTEEAVWFHNDRRLVHSLLCSLSPLDATRRGGQPISRDASHLWLFGGGCSSRVGGVCTGYRHFGFTNAQLRRGFRCTRRGESWSGGATLPAGKSRRSGVFHARMSAASSSATAAGVGGNGVGGGESEVDVDVDQGGRTTFSARTPRSLRTARERGDLKHKTKKSKTSKSKALSSSSSLSSSAAAAVGGSSGGDPSGGPKLLRLSKLLADRAIGSRSEVC